MKIEIKCRFSGSMLFSHEDKNNDILLTLEAAVASHANLDGANLGGANLGGANLGGANLARATLARANLARANLDGANLDGATLARANLGGATLARANLDGANLGGAYLCGATLGGANLDGANLGGAYLCGATLGGANLDGERLTTPPLSLINLNWSVLITANFMRIGCQRHSHDEWRRFTDDQISDMSDEALVFWRKWKAPLLSLCDAYEHAAESKEPK